MFPIAKSLTAINLDDLEKAGIKYIILDVEWTLTPVFKGNDLGKSVKIMDWINEAERKGFKLFIISNSTNEIMVKKVAEWYKIEKYLARGTGEPWKPHRYQKALKVLRIFNAKKAVMIGNNPLRDFWPARRAGMNVIFTLPKIF